MVKWCGESQLKRVAMLGVLVFVLMMLMFSLFNS
jgi:hypothetical protein